MRIVDVELLVAPMSGSWLTEKIVANPMSHYPEYTERRSSWYGSMTAGVVAITVEDGTVGYGFVGGGRARAGKTLVEDQFKSLLVGRNSFAIEDLYDQLTRASMFYGHGGIPLAVISAIDIALWDLKGKALATTTRGLGCSVLGTLSAGNDHAPGTGSSPGDVSSDRVGVLAPLRWFLAQQ